MTEQKQLDASLWTKLQTVMLGLILAVLVFCAIQISGSLHRVNDSLELVQQDLKAVDMTEVNSAVSSLREAADRLAAIDVEGLNKTAQSLKAAADSLANVDVETLNGAIASLQEAADTLKDLDIESLNEVIQSLSKTVANLQKVSDALGSIFGR